MKMYRKITGLSILIMILSISATFGQLLLPESKTDSATVKKVKDTVCFKFDYKPGDTLIYRVVAVDSIIVNLDAPLVRYRTEYLEIVPMETKTKGHVMIRERYYSYIADETQMDKPDSAVRRTSSPWLNRIIYIETDSLGNRYSISYDDTTNAAMAIGGAFQPYIIFPIKESCKAVNESWLMSGTDLLAENSFPPAALRFSTLYRAEEPVDTLGEHCNTFRFVKTGQGTFLYNGPTDTIHITNIINSSGRMQISQDKFVPVHYFTNIEEKITIYNTDGSRIPAWHYTVTDFTLERFLPFNENSVPKTPKRQQQPQRQHRR